MNSKSLETRPKSVAMVGLGPSSREYFSECSRKKNPVHYDEVWGINTAHRSLRCDKIWTMDDLGVIESNYPDWANELKLSDTPIITCRTHPDYPMAEKYPIDEVVKELKDDYFTTTVAYMVAYAAYIGVEKLYLFGVDFYYPNAMIVESGSACVAYWLGVARGKGVHFKIPSSSAMLDANLITHEKKEDGTVNTRRLLYGYDFNPQESNRRVGRGVATEQDKLIAARSYKPVTQDEGIKQTDLEAK